MARNRRSESTQTQPPRTRMSQGTGFALGILAGVAIIAAIWFAYQSGRESAAPQVAATSPAGAQPQAEPLPPPIPAISDAEAHAATRITAQEVKALVDAGNATVIDTRDPQSFAAGHIPGALQIPLDYVQGELSYFPRDKRLIFYCT